MWRTLLLEDVWVKHSSAPYLKGNVWDDLVSSKQVAMGLVDNTESIISKLEQPTKGNSLNMQACHLIDLPHQQITICFV
jgi:hypothetical protein